MQPKKKQNRARTFHKIDVICEDEQEAMEWQTRIINAAYGGDPTVCDSVVEKKRILTLLNPFGGKGKAVKKW